MIFKTLFAAMALAASLPTISQEVPTARAESFTLDPVHSAVLFRVHHAGAGQFWGRFNDVTGTVSWPRDDSAAPVCDIEVPVDSIDTGTDKLDRTLQGPDFFNGREFETMTFTGTSATRDGDAGPWHITGDLTLLGRSRPVTAVIEHTGVVGNPVVAKSGWEATFTINRSDYGMDWGVDNGALGDEVKIIVSLEGNSGPGA